MKILSIQSAVTYGHVGNSAAVFPLQRLGHEVWPIYTVNFSNHTGHASVKGPIIPAADVRDVLQGLEDLDVLKEVDVVLSGYQGSNEITEVILDAVNRVKAANPRAKYVADPVIGNVARGIYVQPSIVPLMREAVVPAANIITPNHFELGILTGLDVSTPKGTLEAIERLKKQGPSTVLVTSVMHSEVADNSLELLVSDQSGTYSLTTPRLPGKLHGTGDLTAALFTAHYLEAGNAAKALEKTTSSVFDIIENTQRNNSPELTLVAAQELLVSPKMQFEVVKLD